MTKKISALPAVASIAGTEQLEVNQGGVSRRATATQLAAIAGGITAAEANTALSAGGSDPITNLQVPFAWPIGVNNVVTITEDGGAAGQPVFTVDGSVGALNGDKIILRANGGTVELYDSTPDLKGYWGVDGIRAGVGIALADGDGLDAFALLNNSGAGQLILRDATQTAQLQWFLDSDAMTWVHADASRVDWDAASLRIAADASGGNLLSLAPAQILVKDATSLNRFAAGIDAITLKDEFDGARFAAGLGTITLKDVDNFTRLTALSDGTGVTLFNAAGDPVGGLSETALTLSDGSFDRIVLYGDGSGINLNDAAGVNRVYMSESGVLVSDAAGLTLVSLQTFGGAGGLDLNDTANVPRVSLRGDGTGFALVDGSSVYRVVAKDDGTGITLNDALGADAGSYATALVLGAEGNNNHGAVIRGWDNAGKLRAQIDLGLISGDTFEVKINDAAETLRNDISCYDEAMEFNHQQDDAVLRSQVTVGASGPGGTEDAVFLGTYDAAALEKGRIKLDNSVLTMGIGSTGITVDAAEINFAASGVGFFGASAYGQDAYLAPLDDNLSALTTLVDLITAENATRTRVNAINGYLIARGWEAAA